MSYKVHTNWKGGLINDKFSTLFSKGMKKMALKIIILFSAHHPHFLPYHLLSVLPGNFILLFNAHLLLWSEVLSVCINFISCDRLVTEYPYVFHETLDRVLPVPTHNYSEIIFKFCSNDGFKNIYITLNNKHHYK